MHYYPSTMGEIVEAVIREKHEMEKCGLRIKKLLFTHFQHQVIIEENKRWQHGVSIQNPSVIEFMGFPVEINDQHGFNVVQADDY